MFTARTNASSTLLGAPLIVAGVISLKSQPSLHYTLPWPPSQVKQIKKVVQNTKMQASP